MLAVLFADLVRLEPVSGAFLPDGSIGDPPHDVLYLIGWQSSCGRHLQIMLVAQGFDQQAGIGIALYQRRARLAALEQRLSRVHAQAALRFAHVAAEALRLQHRLDTRLEELAGRHRPWRPHLNPLLECLNLVGFEPLARRRHAHAPLDSLNSVQQDAACRIPGMDCRAGPASLEQAGARIEAQPRCFSLGMAAVAAACEDRAHLRLEELRFRRRCRRLSDH